MTTASRREALRDERTGVLLREIRLLVPDARDPAVQARLKGAISTLDPEDEQESMRWIESVSLFDNEDRDAE
nr:hypothetical protein REQ54_00330 [Rhizobium sp. Q54]